MTTYHTIIYKVKFFDIYKSIIFYNPAIIQEHIIIYIDLEVM